MALLDTNPQGSGHGKTNVLHAPWHCLFDNICDVAKANFDQNKIYTFMGHNLAGQALIND